MDIQIDGQMDKLVNNYENIDFFLLLICNNSPFKIALIQLNKVNIIRNQVQSIK